MTGQVILAGYDPRRGCIEAYRLVAERGDIHDEVWEWNNRVSIRRFNPKVALLLDNPTVKLHQGWHKTFNRDEQGTTTRWQWEMVMNTGGGESIRSSIELCRATDQTLQPLSTGLWPPESLPPSGRVRNKSKPRKRMDMPRSLAEVSDSTFRLRKWLDFQAAGVSRVSENTMMFSTIAEECYTPTKQKPWQGIWVGDYAGHGCEFLMVLQSAVDPNQPLIRTSGGSSQPPIATSSILEAGGSSENLAINESPSAAESLEDEKTSLPLDEPTEPPEDGSCWGRLEAIKLTGDVNVPRGQYSWIAEDIGPKGLIRIGDEQMFKGARIVRSLGHIALTHFQFGRWYAKAVEQN